MTTAAMMWSTQRQTNRRTNVHKTIYLHRIYWDLWFNAGVIGHRRTFYGTTFSRFFSNYLTKREFSYLPMEQMKLLANIPNIYRKEFCESKWSCDILIFKEIFNENNSTTQRFAHNLLEKKTNSIETMQRPAVVHVLEFLFYAIYGDQECEHSAHCTTHAVVSAGFARQMLNNSVDDNKLDFDLVFSHWYEWLQA